MIKGSGGKTPVTFTITTTALVIAGGHRERVLRSPIYAVFCTLCLSMPGLIIFAGPEQSRRRRKRLIVVLLLTLIVPGLWVEIACSGGLQGNGTGGNGQAGTPTGNYPMTVSATVSGLPQQTAQVQLTVN